MSAKIDISPTLSKRFATMSFVCAIFIVALHSISADRAGTIVRCVHEFFSGGIYLTAIPWFFFAAGFFLAGHIGESRWWSREVLKRVKTLLVPFWFWSAVIFAVNVAFAALIHLYGYRYGGEDALSWLSVNGLLRVIGLDFLEKMPTMWFLRTLFVFVVISPLLVRFSRLGLCALFVVTCCFGLIPGKGDVITKLGYNLFSTRGLFYFTLGLYMRRNGVPFVSSLRISWCIAILGVILCVARVGFVELGFSKIAVFLDSFQLPALTYAVYRISATFDIPKKYTSLSFPLYVTHIVVILCTSAIYGVSGIGGVGNITLLKGICRFGIGLMMTLLFVNVVRKQFPVMSKIIFGNR